MNKRSPNQQSAPNENVVLESKGSTPHTNEKSLNLDDLLTMIADVRNTSQAASAKAIQVDAILW